MNNKDRFILAIVTAILIIAIGFYIWNADFAPNNKEDILLKKIAELELKIDSLSDKKDSIRTVIDSTHIKIITNEKHYQERINTIIRQSSSDDSSFVANYIRQYSDKNSLSNIK